MMEEKLVVAVAGYPEQYDFTSPLLVHFFGQVDANMTDDLTANQRFQIARAIILGTVVV